LDNLCRAIEQPTGPCPLGAHLQEPGAAVDTRGGEIDQRPAGAFAGVGVADDIERRRKRSQC
jgi:hypothetical protein